jgi:threonine synthase
VKYASSRGKGQTCSAAEAIRSGIAADGGLFVPIKLPSMGVWTKAEQGNYVQLAAEVLGKLLTDYTASELEGCAAAAYADNFDNRDVVPLIRVGNRFVLELWHGPTSAFKDMALQIMPRLLTLAMDKTGETSDMLILVATSGDTGKAALEGFRDVPGTNILVFYPSEGVSEVQRRQMITQEGKNVGVVAVEGNFDDAQTGVKKIFADNRVREVLAQKQLKLSSANSINWGRLAPQIAYYFSAYQSLCAQGTIGAGDPVNFCVPTGNFGNILAGYYAKRMGLPIHRLICASNDNNVLTEFLRTGIYDRNRSFHQTISPSMDILISSNLERLLYHVTDGDTERVRQWMTDLNVRGHYEIDAPTLAEIQKIFWADWASENDSKHIIKQVWETDNYLLDPHTAVAWKVADAYDAMKSDGAATVVLSTASPFKFADSVLQALGDVEAVAATDSLELLNRLAARTGWKIPTNLANLSAKPLRHQEMCQVSVMPEIVLNFMDKLKSLKG